MIIVLNTMGSMTKHNATATTKRNIVIGYLSLESFDACLQKDAKQCTGVTKPNCNYNTKSK